MLSAKFGGFLIILLLCLLVVILFSIFVFKKKSPSLTDVVFTYADGSGNFYTITSGQYRMFAYEPKSAAESSSGVYSGGERVKKQISEEQFKQIIVAFETARKNTSAHIPNREMKSGLVTLKSGNGQTSFILAPNSPELVEIERVLSAIRQ